MTVDFATDDEDESDSEEIAEAERQRRANRRFQELNHLNGDIDAILQGRGHKAPAPKAATEERLFNSGAVMLAEDLVLNGGRNELIRLHGYFAEHFLKEQRKMTVISNMLSASTSPVDASEEQTRTWWPWCCCTKKTSSEAVRRRYRTTTSCCRRRWTCRPE